MRACSLVLAISGGLFACSATPPNTFSGTGGDGTGAAGGGTSGGTGGGTDTIHVGGGGGGQSIEEEVFAQSATTLYRLDPVTSAVTVVGDFQGCDSAVIDIAIDKTGAMYATTSSSLAKVDKKTAVCTTIAAGSFPNSLSFVPVGTVDPNTEALVGYQGDTYVRINIATGAVKPIGQLGGGYFSSGDIVSAIGGGTYLTVNGNGCDDCIVEVDPKTGALTKLIGDVGHSGVYGLAFWGGTAYGFDEAGDLFAIDLSNGKTTPIALPNPPAGLSFYGAGSTTAAPLKPPN